MGVWNISDLKKHLGPGLGLRSDKYLIEMAVPGLSGRAISIGCRLTSLPERKIQNVPLFYRGRRYFARAETEYPGSITINFIDTSNMDLRRMFDDWARRIDDSVSYGEEEERSFLKDITATINNVNNVISKLKKQKLTKILLHGFEGESNSYFSTATIWQMNQRWEKVYGYSLGHVSISNIGTVELSDDNVDKLTEFSVELSYSEFEPVNPPTTVSYNVFEKYIGKDGRDLIKAGKGLINNIKGTSPVDDIAKPAGDRYG